MLISTILLNLTSNSHRPWSAWLANQLFRTRHIWCSLFRLILRRYKLPWSSSFGFGRIWVYQFVNGGQTCACSLFHCSQLLNALGTTSYELSLHKCIHSNVLRYWLRCYPEKQFCFYSSSIFIMAHIILFLIYILIILFIYFFF